MRSDVYERITSKIVSDLEAAVRSWMKPWNAEPRQAASAVPYSPPRVQPALTFAAFRPVTADPRAYWRVPTRFFWQSI